MSSIETLKTDASPFPVNRLISLWRTTLVTASLLLIWISFEPFNGGTPTQIGGSLINQIGYTSVTGLLILTLLTCVSPAVATRLLSLPWLAMFVWVILSGVFVSSMGDAAVRGASFSVIVAVLAAGLIAVIPSERALLAALCVSIFGVLLLSYGGLLILPNAAIHTSFEAEPQHAGFWRGVFFHKNIAGPVMAVIMFAGVYIARRSSIVIGLLIAALGFLFVYETGSKTSLALAPLVLVLVLLLPLLGMRFLVPIAGVIAVAGAHALTLGTVYVDTFDVIVRTISPDTTFTGRTEIWGFAKEYALENPLTGYGYAGFWRTDLVRGAEQAFDSSWDPRGIVHGHNGYLDALLLFGIPGLLLMIWITLVSPAMQYGFAVRTKANDALNDFFYMVILFATLNASLESFFFNRADPVWLILVVSLFGLRLTSRFAIKH